MSNTQHWRAKQRIDAIVRNLQHSGQDDMILQAIDEGERAQHVAAQLALVWSIPFGQMIQAVTRILRENNRYA